MKEEILDWQDAEGVTLRVEVLQGGVWKTVQSVPAAGLTRHLGLALPAPVDPGDLQVRISGAVGFWQVDELALSKVAPADSNQVRHLAPTVALDDLGGDQRAALASSDGAYQVLGQPGDALALEFDVPPLEEGRARSAFFASRGYYNVSGIAKGWWSPLALLLLHHRTGGLARLSLEAARDPASAEMLRTIERDLKARRRLPR
jgi:hypothetical protein